MTRRQGITLSILITLILLVIALIFVEPYNYYQIPPDTGSGLRKVCSPYSKCGKPVEQAPPADYKRERVSR